MSVDRIGRGNHPAGSALVEELKVERFRPRLVDVEAQDDALMKAAPKLLAALANLLAKRTPETIQAAWAAIADAHGIR